MKLSEDRPRVLFVFFQYFDSASRYGNALWPEILDCDMAEPLLSDGQSLYESVRDHFCSMIELDQYRHALLNGDILRFDMYCPSREYSTDVRLLDSNCRPTDKIVSIHDYEVVLIADIAVYYSYIAFLREVCPGLAMVAVQETSLQELRYAEAHFQAAFLQVVRAVDGYVVFSEEAKNWFSAARPTLAMTMPVPLKEIKSIVPPPTTENEDESAGFRIGLGVGAWNADFNNILSSYHVMTLVRDHLGTNIQSVVCGTGRRSKDLAYWHEYDSTVAVHDYLAPVPYYSTLSSLDVVIQLSGRAMIGRMQAECAVFSVPVVGNRQIQMQLELWPSLSVEEFDVFSAVDLVKRVLTDPQLRTTAIKYAQERLSHLEDWDGPRLAAWEFLKQVYDTRRSIDK